MKLLFDEQVFGEEEFWGDDGRLCLWLDKSEHHPTVWLDTLSSRVPLFTSFQRLVSNV